MYTFPEARRQRLCYTDDPTSSRLRERRVRGRCAIHHLTRRDAVREAYLRSHPCVSVYINLHSTVQRNASPRRFPAIARLRGTRNVPMHEVHRMSVDVSNQAVGGLDEYCCTQPSPSSLR